MKPVVFDGCSGWLHPADGSHGVVLCNPFGYDALCTHRGWRKLAERIAAAGMPALRFDYPGTGDAAGFEEDPQRIEAWIDSIVQALARLRAWTGVERVSLVGLRFGATLAALAAERSGDVDGLVLLAPPVVGRNYLRELRTHRQQWLSSTSAGLNAEPLEDDARYAGAFGFGLHGEDVERLAQIDLRRDTARPARRVLLLDSSDRVRTAALAAHYAAQQVSVEQQPFDECDRFMLEALYSEEPSNAFGAVTAWLADHGAQAKRTTADVEPAPRLRIPAPAQAATEYPTVFGRYFGVYCAPDKPRADAPAVLFLNTGASHHVGDGRVFVLFARRLAAQGIASLRMDLGGLGDATPTAGTVTLDTIYADASWRDAMAGADWLVARGHARVATFGVCGGAFVGLHASAHHPAIVGTFGVNLQKFVWDGAQRDPGSTQPAEAARVYLRSALSAEKWRKALSGESHPLRIARALGPRLARRAWVDAAGWIERGTGLAVVRNDARALMHAVHAKGVHARLVYGDYDLGLDEARMQFGARLAALRGYPRVQVATLPRLDHALFTNAARENVMADAQRWLLATLVDTPARAAVLLPFPPPERATGAPASRAAARGRLDGVHP